MQSVGIGSIGVLKEVLKLSEGREIATEVSFWELLKT